MQIVHAPRRWSRNIEHIGSADDDQKLELLKTVARAGRCRSPRHGWVPAGCPRERLPGPSFRRRRWRIRGVLPSGADPERAPVRKLDSLRVLREAGVAPVSYSTPRRRLPFLRDGRGAAADVRGGRGARQAGIGQPRLHDVSTLSFETDTEECSPRAGVLPDVTIVADAGMMSEANHKQIEAADQSFILRAHPIAACTLAQRHGEHPGEEIPDGHVFTQPGQPARTAAAATRSPATSTGLSGPGARGRA